MANNQNLKPFTGADDPRRGHKQKGVPHSKTRLIRLLQLTENLTNPITKEEEGFTVAEQLDLAQIIKARKGSTIAYNSIMDRLEGKPQMFTDITTDGESLNKDESIKELLIKLLAKNVTGPTDKGITPEQSTILGEGKDKP